VFFVVSNRLLIFNFNALKYVNLLLCDDLQNFPFSAFAGLDILYTVSIHFLIPQIKLVVTEFDKKVSFYVFGNYLSSTHICI